MVKKEVIVVRKKDAEGSRRILLKVGLLDKEYKPLKKGDFVYFPLKKHKLVPSELLHVPFTLTTTSLDKFPRSPLNSLIIKLKRKYCRKPEFKVEKIGNLALLWIAEDFSSHKEEIIKAVSQTYKIRGIFEKISEVKGLHRIPKIRHLSGSKSAVTIHTEYGIKICVNLEKAYFNSRLANEHNRIASLVSLPEQILDMFAGVGPYSLHIAKKIARVEQNYGKVHKSRIVAVDINPTAIEFLERSTKLNKLEGTIYPIVADSAHVFNKQIRFNRIIMNLPHASYQYLPLATSILQTRGIIHFYTFSRKENPITAESAKFISISQNRLKISSVAILKDVAPHKVVVRVDAIKK
ncbi:MAG: class I SAM-dependent methyltransferase family protein [Promethearchaeota archaeon]